MPSQKKFHRRKLWRKVIRQKYALNFQKLKFFREINKRGYLISIIMPTAMSWLRTLSLNTTNFQNTSILAVRRFSIFIKMELHRLLLCTQWCRCTRVIKTLFWEVITSDPIRCNLDRTYTSSVEIKFHSYKSLTFNSINKVCWLKDMLNRIEIYWINQYKTQVGKFLKKIQFSKSHKVAWT